jgi:aldehyde:ferredoxin oxidoreductase
LLELRGEVQAPRGPGNPKYAPESQVGQPGVRDDRRFRFDDRRNDNLPAVARPNQLGNLYGLDSVSMGNIATFAMECLENGILAEKDTGGRPLKFGEPDAMLWLIEQVVHRRGFGDILAEGVKAASEKISQGSEQFAFTIKSNDIPFQDGHGKTDMALGYASSSAGQPDSSAPVPLQTPYRHYDSVSPCAAIRDSGP